MFRNFIMENFPFLENDFDALTDYELFCKMMEYVKQFAKDNEDFKRQLNALENYIYNLDIQDAVNNKLDEMAESGELAEIISQYLELATTYTYNSVAEMKAATNLVNGSFARTSGFYSYNDGGGAFYKVRTITNDDVIDEMTIIELADNSLIAELLVLDSMNPKQFGAYGNATNDDTIPIQKCLDYCKNVIIKDGTFMIDAFDGVNLKSNSHVQLINAKLKAITNDLETYSIVNIDDVDNVIFEGGSIEGDKESHTGETGEHGHCVHLKNGSTNITIKDMNISNGWGDGIYANTSIHVTIDNVDVNHNRRNGISIIDVVDFKVINSTISYTNGTAPECGIDIEPNQGDETIDVLIDNCNIHHNDGSGIDSTNRYPDTYPNALSNVTISNCTLSSNGGYGAEVKYINYLSVLNNKVLNNTDWGIVCTYENGCNISNNLISHNGSCINVYGSENSVINNNICEFATANNKHGVAVQGCSNLSIKNNIIRKNTLSGIVLSSISSTQKSSYNIVENNKIYDNGTSASGTYNNVAFNNYCDYNIVKDNDFIGTNTDLAYNINFTSVNSANNNYVIGNIMATQTTGDMYLRNNKTLDNIIDGTLSAGNLRT